MELIVFFMDHRLCFGLKCGPYYFNLISEFIFWSCSRLFGIDLVNNLDDFICVARSFGSCLHAQSAIIKVLCFIRMQISWSKVTPPSQVTVYLSITIDSTLMELRLPEAKVVKLKCPVKEFRGKSSATKHQLECFSGLLAHCSTVVWGGRTFCRRIYDAQKIACKTKWVRLNALAKDDIEWWFHFAEVFNGRAAILKSYFMSDFTSDASRTGFAVFTDFDQMA